MKLVLEKDVDDLGLAGDVVTVRAGYARNFLFPRRMAVKATANNLKRVEKLKRETELRHQELRSSAENLAARLTALQIVIKRKVGEEDKLYGSVTNSDIGDELQKQGFDIDRRKIHLGEHIKAVGDYQVRVKLFQNVFAEVKISVQPE